MKSLLFIIVALLLLLAKALQHRPAGAVGISAGATQHRPAKAAPTARTAPAAHPLIVVRKSSQAPARPKIVRALPPAKPLPY